MQVTILGNGSGGPFSGRHYTAQLVQTDKHLFLVDCGEGTQMQMYAFRTKQDSIRHIFITHLHGDHVFGLIGLITGWCLKKRSESLTIFSPPGLRELLETTIRVCGVRLSYPIDYQEVDATVAQVVFENEKLEISTIPLHHRSLCCGWLFREKPLPRNIISEKITEYQIHFSLIPGIKAGADLQLPDGRLIPNAELTTPPRPSLSYAFCSDTAFHPPVIDYVKGVDLLYHEATFTDEHSAEAVFSFHSTAAQAAEIARQAGVKRLLLGHFSGRYTDTDQHLTEARAVFEATYIAEEGSVWQVNGQESKPSSVQKSDKKIVEASKFLSKVLRHEPQLIGLQLDENGWANVSELLAKAEKKGHKLDRQLLETIVQTSDKQRFALRDNGEWIRANQGHSVDISLNLPPQAPPDILYHGTAEQNLPGIRAAGLKRMKRQHVHLSPDIETAKRVGGRHGKAVVLRIQAGEMARQGILFYCSDNGVWLTESVDNAYITLL